MMDRFAKNTPRVSSVPSTVWVFTSKSGKQWIEVTAADLPIETAMQVFEHSDADRFGDEPYYVQNLTVGGPIRLRRHQPLQGDLYFNDGRKFHSDGRVTL